MSQAAHYSYTAAHVASAVDEIKATLFRGITREAIPKVLVIAGLQGSGKTWLLEKTLLPTHRYANYVRLYLTGYREKHPHYAQMLTLGVLHAYEHTEAFVREIGSEIFKEAFRLKYNIIMECAFDSLDFAAFAPSASNEGYQFDVHLVACTQEFAHVSSIKRALKSLENQALERFVTFAALETSTSNARAIILAFETAAKMISGSQISLYERGLGELKERTLRAQSIYTKASDGVLTVTASTLPFSFRAYSEIVDNHVHAMSERDEMVKECHHALLRTLSYRDLIPGFAYNDLYAYIIKYVNR